ncbi:MAG: hypothetical protein ACRDY4_02990 [Acidimicrobiia bacterium]
MTGACGLDEFLALLLRRHEDSVDTGTAAITRGLRRREGDRRAIRSYARMAETDRASARRAVDRLGRQLRRIDRRVGGVLDATQVTRAARALVVQSLGVRDPLVGEADAAFDAMEAARARIPLRWWWRRARGDVDVDDPLLAVERELERLEADHAAVWRRWAAREEF